MGRTQVKLRIERVGTGAGVGEGWMFGWSSGKIKVRRIDAMPGLETGLGKVGVGTPAVVWFGVMTRKSWRHLSS